MAACLTLAWAQYQQQQYTTPIPILKQINRQNEDGSYSYGYEGADGSYKIETKGPTGEVFGKYGYIDDAGSLREVEYGASQRGFEPAGQGIDVAPPTLTNNNNYLGSNGQDDGQYREDPSVYYKDPKYNDGYSYPGTSSSSSSSRQQYSQPRYNQQAYSQPKYSQPSQTYSQPSYSSQTYRQPSYSSQASDSQSNYNSQPRYSRPRYEQDYQNSYYNSQPSYNRQPIYVDPNQFRGHPASNFDINSGSYTVSYKK